MEPYLQYGAFGVLVGFIYWVLQILIPSMMSSFRAEISEERALFAEQIKIERAECATQFREISRELDGLGRSIDKHSQILLLMLSQGQGPMKAAAAQILADETDTLLSPPTSRSP